MVAFGQRVPEKVSGGRKKEKGMERERGEVASWQGQLKRVCRIYNAVIEKTSLAIS